MRPTARGRCFNPHPARRPDAICNIFSGRDCNNNVSILTRPEGRMLSLVRVLCWPDGGPFQSSPGPKAGCYHTPNDWQHGGLTFQSSPGPKAGCYAAISLSLGAGNVFQSSPGPKAGCYFWLVSIAPPQDLFQSSPGPKAGCYPLPGGAEPASRQVSILTRPEGRMLCGPRSRASPASRRFNPHPARRPDAITTCRTRRRRPTRFQSSPGPKAGCYA